MKHKIPDILFMGFVCMFFFVAIGGIWGFIVNWIIFGWLAYEQNVRYNVSPLGVREHLLSGFYKKYIDDGANKYKKSFCGSGLTNYDWQVIAAIQSIQYYVENEYKGYKNVSNKKLTIVSKANEMLTGNIASTPDNNAPYCVKLIDGNVCLSVRKLNPENNKMEEVMIIDMKTFDTKVAPWYGTWWQTHGSD